MQVLLLCKHGHHDERVQVDAFTQHPEVIAAQHVHVEEVQHLTADLQTDRGRENTRISYLFLAPHMKKKIHLADSIQTLLTPSQQDAKKI